MADDSGMRKAHRLHCRSRPPLGKASATGEYLAASEEARISRPSAEMVNLGGDMRRIADVYKTITGAACSRLVSSLF
jgi:hypothetical protein